MSIRKLSASGSRTGGAGLIYDALMTNNSNGAAQGHLELAAEARPTFNLWTSILLFREQPSDSPLYTRLAGEAKAFVDKMKTGDNPCTKKPEDCFNGPRAPYNFQAAVTELGDVFLRRAETYLQAGDVPHAMEMARRRRLGPMRSPRTIGGRMSAPAVTGAERCP